MKKVKILLKLLGVSVLIGWIVHQIEVIDWKNLFKTETIQSIEDDITIIEKESLSELDLRKIKTGKRRFVTATYYNPVPEQCSGDPLITASGKKIDLDLLENEEIKWIAVSRDLLEVYNYGDKVKITCEEDPSIDGVYEIADTMNKRFENKIDLLWPVGKTGQGKWKVQIDPV